MSIEVPALTDFTVAEVVHDMDTKGYCVIPEYIRPEDLGRMRGFVDGAVRQSGNEYVHFNGPEAVNGSGLEQLAASPHFLKLMHDLYEKATGRPAPEQRFYQVLRCLIGETGQKNSLIFHYDSYIITALVPIRIPESGMAGDLLMFPNTRKIRKTYLFNAVDKVLLDNPLRQRMLRAAAGRQGSSGPVRIRMVPGNLYLFWGYRSIHANEPCDPDKVRATALYHYANPHRAD